MSASNTAFPVRDFYRVLRHIKDDYTYYIENGDNVVSRAGREMVARRWWSRIHDLERIVEQDRLSRLPDYGATAAAPVIDLISPDIKPERAPVVVDLVTPEVPHVATVDPPVNRKRPAEREGFVAPRIPRARLSCVIDEDLSPERTPVSPVYSTVSPVQLDSVGSVNLSVFSDANADLNEDFDAEEASLASGLYLDSDYSDEESTLLDD